MLPVDFGEAQCLRHVIPLTVAQWAGQWLQWALDSGGPAGRVKNLIGQHRRRGYAYNDEKRVT